ncbi:MAG TPA: hypothetical protein VF355_07970 [Anaerolineaceae bacterium]
MEYAKGAVWVVFPCNDYLSGDGLTAQVRLYDRPWGEPWYSFQDTWVEKGGQIYMIACQTPLKLHLQ